MRERIIEEAANMFRTYGIRAVTMDMLATQMGMSKRTIYEIFRDKEELLAGVMRWMEGKQADLIKDCLANSENVIEAIFRMMDTMLSHYRKMSPAFKLDIKKYHNEMKKIGRHAADPFENSKEILGRGVKEGLFRDDIDLDITDRCLKGMSKMNEKEAPHDFENEEVIRDFFVNYLRGISTSEGIELINKYDTKKQ
jgi:AcrR family transcriptional regulator